jgi:hypothetical protein
MTDYERERGIHPGELAEERRGVAAAGRAPRPAVTYTETRAYIALHDDSELAVARRLRVLRTLDRYETRRKSA